MDLINREYLFALPHWVYGTDELSRLRAIVHRIETAPSIIIKHPCTPDCRWFGTRHQKCSCCRRNWNMKDNYERRADNG